MKKRIISAVAAVCLVLSSAAALPQGVFDTAPTITASAVSTATSGTCGENLTWTLNLLLLNRALQVLAIMHSTAAKIL